MLLAPDKCASKVAPLWILNERVFHLEMAGKIFQNISWLNLSKVYVEKCNPKENCVYVHFILWKGMYIYLYIFVCFTGKKVQY